jgi:hypothetical protein
VRRFGDADMWNTRNQAAGKTVDGPDQIPATAIDVTAESGASMSELTPLFLANQGGMVLTTATDYGTLHAAGRPG